MAMALGVTSGSSLPGWGQGRPSCRESQRLSSCLQLVHVEVVPVTAPPQPWSSFPPGGLFLVPLDRPLSSCLSEEEQRRALKIESCAHAHAHARTGGLRPPVLL